MADFFEAFGKGKKAFLPVIHVVDSPTAVENTRVAEAEGADGVFLINHSMTAQRLWPIYEEVRDNYPDFWIGVNCLDLSPIKVFREAPIGIDGVWVDNAGTAVAMATFEPLEDITLARVHRGLFNETLYFGGVGMKHQPEIPDDLLGLVAHLSSGWVDIVTTSGPATGVSAPIKKIEKMKMGIGLLPLALCSGVSAENVEEYLPYVNAFLVASSISVHDQSGVDMLVPDKVRALAEKIHR
ncbi:MAG: BtpA/SgcQ family protein [bacterium]|nr:BtpA/SgcQ family protein [bacterium]